MGCYKKLNLLELYLQYSGEDILFWEILPALAVYIEDLIFPLIRMRDCEVLICQ